MAVTADGVRWVLLNASPDVRTQLESLPSTRGPDVIRLNPVSAIVLTDAELDHTLGLLLLREGGAVTVYGTSGIFGLLARDGSAVLSTLAAFAVVNEREMPLELETDLVDGAGVPLGLRVTAFAAGGDPPRFAASPAAADGVGSNPATTVGLLIQDPLTGGTLAFVPGCAELSPAVADFLRRADIVLFDGTCWSDDEMFRTTGGGRTARAMGHQPVMDPQGTLPRIAAVLNGSARRSPRWIYTHLNNTNPLLVEHSPERGILRESAEQLSHATPPATIEVGYDGMEFEL